MAEAPALRGLPARVATCAIARRCVGIEAAGDTMVELPKSLLQILQVSQSLFRHPELRHLALFSAPCNYEVKVRRVVRARQELSAARRKRQAQAPQPTPF